MSKSDHNLKTYPSSSEQNEKGMTLRDYFAAEALNAIIQNQGTKETPANRTEQAFIAFQYADEMLHQRLDLVGNPGPED